MLGRGGLRPAPLPMPPFGGMGRERPQRSGSFFFLDSSHAALTRRRRSRAAAQARFAYFPIKWDLRSASGGAVARGAWRQPGCPPQTCGGPAWRRQVFLADHRRARAADRATLSVNAPRIRSSRARSVALSERRLSRVTRSELGRSAPFLQNARSCILSAFREAFVASV